MGDKTRAVYTRGNMLKLVAVTTCLLVPCLAFAQNDSDNEIVHRHNVSFGVGPAIPVGSSTTQYLTTAPMIRLIYGYRFNKWVQAESGLQMAFGAANNQNPVLTGYGPVLGGDHEFLIPMGARLYIPQPVRKVSLSIGGGETYLHYSETAPSNGYYSSGCYSCTSRGGWGPYGLATLMYFLDSNQNFHLGVTGEYINGSTNGQVVANFPATKTTDHWLGILFEFGLSF